MTNTSDGTSWNLWLSFSAEPGHMSPVGKVATPNEGRRAHILQASLLRRTEQSKADQPTIFLGETTEINW